MKFRYLPNTDKPNGIYDGKTAEQGDVVEYDGHFAKKALNNPNFEAISDGDPSGSAKQGAAKAGHKAAGPKRARRVRRDN